MASSLAAHAGLHVLVPLVGTLHRLQFRFLPLLGLLFGYHHHAWNGGHFSLCKIRFSVISAWARCEPHSHTLFTRNNISLASILCGGRTSPASLLLYCYP